MIPSLLYMKNEVSEIDDALKKTLDTKVNLIREPLHDMINSGGKRLRPLLVLSSARFGPSYDFKRIKPLAVAMELIHMATLVHDDVIDDSPVRRGKPSLQAKLGKDVAVFTGDFIFSKVFELLASTDNHTVLHYASKILYKICEGEIKQREELFDTSITFKDYLYRIQRKTAILFTLCCQLGALSSGSPEKVLRILSIYGTKIGIAFQMMDDLLDLRGQEDILGKVPGTDIREGVVTLPAIYALKHSRNKKTLEQMLKKGDCTNNEVKIAMEIIKESGALEYIEEISTRYIKKAKDVVSQLPCCAEKDFLFELADYITSRNR